jgi:hypothetical protein
VRGYDLELLADPATIPWTYAPLSLPDRAVPLMARLAARA